MDLRPRPDQTDEDLVKENEQFLNMSKRKSESDSHADSSSHEFQEMKRQKPVEHVEDFMHNEPTSILTKAKAPDLLLSDVIEKNIGQVLADHKPNPISSKQGFPVAFRRDKSLTATSGKSIFARMQESKMVVEKSDDIATASQPTPQKINASEDQKIHEENLQKLAKMTQEEIISAQQELLSKLNPAAIQLLKARGTSKSKKFSAETKAVEPMEVVSDTSRIKVTDVAMESEELTGIPIEPAEAKKWLHMDVVETEKLRWMTQLPKPKPVAAGQAYAARFNFDGSLLDPNAELPVTQALHHHGEEQERAGYTLEELLLFSRSSIPQQRAIGLTTIANILSLSKHGRLDQCLEEPILPQLLSAGIFAALRFSLDEGVPMVTEAAAQALAALLCSEPDEVCLRQLRGTSYAATLPGLSCPLEEEGPKEKGQEVLQEGELKDHELLQLDVVKGAMRTQLVQRIRYLLTNMKPTPRTVQCLLRVLMRLAMHSREVALEVAGCPDLMASIIKHFLPSSWEPSTQLPTEIESVYGVPQARALSLARVLASQSRAIASDLVHKLSIMRPVLAYLAVEPCETGIPDGSSVVLESLYLWQTLLSHALALSELREFSGVLGKLVSHHCAQTGLEAPRFLVEHAVTSLSLLQTLLTLSPTLHGDKVPRELMVSLGPALLRATARWMSEATGSLSFSQQKLLGAGLNIVCAGYTHALNWKEVDEVVWLSQLETVLRSVLPQFVCSGALSQLTAVLCKHSSLLSDQANSGKKRDPQGLPSLGAVMWGQVVTPTMQATSPLPLLEPLCAFLTCACQLLPHTAPRMLDILQQPGVRGYFQQMATQGCPGAHHWFSRWEERLACCLFNLATHTKDGLESRVFHLAALNLLPALSFKHLTTQLMSSWDEVTSGLLGSLQLTESTKLPTVSSQPSSSNSELLRQAYDNLPALLTCYSALPELPRDWPYLPLVAAASSAEQAKPQVDPQQLQHCLQWLLLLENLRPEVVSQMLSVTGRFCRVSCVFLCGSDIFLDPHIHALAEDVLRRILSSGELNLTENIPGLKTFWELYVALARAFVAESYSDALFCNVVLLPLRQCHDPAYRKHLWGEQAAAIRFLRLEQSQLLVGLKGFLDPPEQDTTLLNCYLRLLISGTARGVLATIAAHHLMCYARNGSDGTLRSHISNSLASAPSHVQSVVINDLNVT
ncbi:hypothetical protein B566_EDAN013901 [Ephemera danica]|nr:hypothetical protein B566_EDAN013901 [Ephemera danica]